MGPSPGVSGGEESGMKPSNQVPLVTESTKRQRRPSVRLGEPSDHPASIILLNPPKKRRVEEEEEDEEDEEDQEHEEPQDKENDKKLDDDEVLDQVQEEGDEYHDVPVQGDFPLSSKVIPPKTRTRTLEHVASTASQTQRLRDAAASAALVKPAGSGEPVLSPKGSQLDGAVAEQEVNGEQVAEQVSSPVQAQSQSERASSGTRRQPLNNGLGKRGKSRRGGRRGGSGAPYKSIGGILQARKRPKDGKEGKIKEDEKNSKDLETVVLEKPAQDTQQDDRGPDEHMKEESSFQEPPPPPPSVTLEAPPPASDKEIESSERGPGSSEATQSSFNEKVNGEEVPPEVPQHEKEKKDKEKLALPVLLPVPSPRTSPVLGTTGERNDTVKLVDAPLREVVRVEHRQEPGRTVGEMSLLFLQRAVNSFPGGVNTWLAALGLGHLTEVFDQNEVDAVVLPLLTMEDLTEMRIPTGPKRKMFSAIQVLREAVL